MANVCDCQKWKKTGKLYHWTSAENLPGIAKGGLTVWPMPEIEDKKFYVIYGGVRPVYLSVCDCPPASWSIWPEFPVKLEVDVRGLELLPDFLGLVSAAKSERWNEFNRARATKPGKMSKSDMEKYLAESIIGGTVAVAQNIPPERVRFVRYEFSNAPRVHQEHAEKLKLRPEERGVRPVFRRPPVRVRSYRRRQ